MRCDVIAQGKAITPRRIAVGVVVGANDQERASSGTESGAHVSIGSPLNGEGLIENLCTSFEELRAHIGCGCLQRFGSVSAARIELDRKGLHVPAKLCKVHGRDFARYRSDKWLCQDRVG